MPPIRQHSARDKPLIYGEHSSQSGEIHLLSLQIPRKPGLSSEAGYSAWRDTTSKSLQGCPRTEVVVGTVRTQRAEPGCGGCSGADLSSLARRAVCPLS